VILHRERANQVFEKRQARLLIFFSTARPPSKSGAAAYRRRGVPSSVTPVAALRSKDRLRPVCAFRLPGGSRTVRIL